MNTKIKRFLNKLHTYRYLAYKWHKHNVLKNPKAEANRWYSSVFKKNINWENPKNLPEKTYWLQFYTDTTLWTKFADKYLVREYIKKCGFEDNLTNLYGKWDNANDIDFSKLPDRFVLKTNHSCGTVLIVKDKSKIDIKSTRKILNRWLSIPFGYAGAQLHYTKIKPCIIAEELLINKKAPNKSLIDYKIWCFHGKPWYIEVIFNRTDKGYSQSMYNLNWENISSTTYNKEILNTGQNISKPLSFDKMIDIATKISEGFPQVRVDLYNVNNKPFFGEMTLTAGGYRDYTKEFYNHLGGKVDLTKVEKIS